MIDRRLYEIIKHILNESAIKSYPKEFSIRIIIQKILYLLTHGSENPQIDIPYKWNFYLHGPYSPEISQMIYHMNEVFDEIPNKKVDLKRRELEAIEHFMELKDELEKSQLNDPALKDLDKKEIYEIIATLTYISNQMRVDKSKLLEKFRKFKPELENKISSDAYELFYSLLKKYQYI